ncbi:MAG: right-handed parallel beta-helix repeat-containing protein, partial [Candidatus Polarisedimenticolia bacterium]
DTIVFNIPGAGPHTITPSIGGPLPAVTETLTIDASAELLPSGAPGVVLSGSSCGDCDGLTLNTQDTIVRALAINNFSNSGVRIEGGTNNRVQACFLGVAPDGTTAAGNRDGVNTASTNVPLVGGGSADGNLISGNSSRGVRMLFGTIDGVVQSCTIGTTRNGVSPLPNVGGVDLSGDDAGVAFNTLSGNSTSGVIIDDGRFNLVRFNVIGTDPSGLLAVSNQFEGVLLSSADNNDVLQNRISGNTPGSGVHLIGSTGNLVRQNLIGLRASDPPGPLPNNEGILIEAAQDNMLSSNFISGNLGPGVWLRALASGNEVTGNWIGIGDDLVTPMANNSGVRFTGDSWNNIVSGNLVVYNSDDGILVSESPGNKILGNTVSGNTDAGIQITGAGSSGNLLETNRIGTDEAGIAALPNLRGVVIDAGASGNEVGASNTGNLISGNSGPGVLITGSMSTGNRVIENLIGTDVTGTAPLGNGTGVLIVAGANNFVGGLNVISANGNNLVIDSAGGIPAGNRVTNNYLGTDISGTAPLGTGGDNVVLNDSQAVMLIGNIIGGNHTRGLRISGGGFNEVHGNDFGVGPSGGPIGLSGPGISIENGSVGNLIGNGLPGGENVIANNNGNGIQVLDTGLDNDIRRNSIHSNAGLAIDLGNDGVTANDNQDQDAGPNTRQNFPSLTAASTSSGDMAIQGTLHSTPGANFTLEFYASPTCDPSGHGEGARYLGSGNAATLVDGTSLPYSFNFMRAVSPSEFITATARLIATPGDTSGSEFSACLLPSTTTPIDVSPTMAMAPGETEMMWGPVAGAQSYTLYRGLPADLEHLPATTPATLQGVPNACTRWSGTTPTTGPILTEEPPPGSFFWYLVSATGIYGEGGVGAGSLGPRQILSSGPCTGSFCPHDKCMQGDPLSTNCGGCVASICAVDPYCCNTAWDNICVGEVRTVCNNFTCLESAGSCNHTLCSFGPTLTSGCDVPPLSAGCVAQICAVDPYCCDEHWDAICINEVTTICGKQCD